MKKINVVKDNFLFNDIISSNKPFKYRDYYLYIDRNYTGVFKFGISVGKKIGNATVRNLYKRRIRSIIDKGSYVDNFRCIIIVGRGILNRSYKEMEDNLLQAFYKAGIIKENRNEKR